MDKGVGIIDPSRFDLRGELEIGHDNEIDINVVMEGKLKLQFYVKKVKLKTLKILEQS